MDEMQLIRDAYPEPAPPTARETAEARALLDAPRRRRLPRLRWGLSGVVAVGAAAAVAVTLVGGNPSEPSGPPAALRLDPKGAFLAAANKAAQQRTGNYWFSDEISGQSYVVRPKTGAYTVIGAHAESFHWASAKAGAGEGMLLRDLPTRPLTAKDAALWRKAGSPSRFRVWSGGQYLTFGTKATKWKPKGPDIRSTGKFMDMTPEEIRNLPTSPDALARKFLSDDDTAAGIGPIGRDLSASQLATIKLFRVSGLLTGAPLPPKVRSGLMKALAQQPHIQAIGRVADPLGRRGVALAGAERTTKVNGDFGTPKVEQGTFKSRDVLVFDERTGAVLARQNVLTEPGARYREMKPGFIIEFQAIRATGWSDAKPKPDAALPYR